MVRAIVRRWRWPPERDAALAHDRPVACWEAENVVVQLGGFAGALDPLFLRPRIAISYVVLDRGGEQECILLCDRDRFAKRRQGDFADVLSIKRDGAPGHVIKAGDQVSHCRFARTRRTDDRDRLAPTRLKVDVFQNHAVFSAGIFKRDIVEAQSAFADLEGLASGASLIVISWSRKPKRREPQVEARAKALTIRPI